MSFHQQFFTSTVPDSYSTTATVPHSIEFNNKIITDPTVMKNFCNNYFISIAKVFIRVYI